MTSLTGGNPLLMGVTDDLFKWLKYFVVGRAEVVTILGHHTSPYEITAVVPQKLLLRPLLFDAYVNDTNTNASNITLLTYIDDIKQYFEIQRADHMHYTSLLQSDLDTLQPSITDWQLKLVVHKCAF